MAIIETEFLELTRNLDVNRFWADNQQCETVPELEKLRCGLIFAPDDHWLFGFLGVESTIRYYFNKPYRDSLHRQVNRLTADYIGMTFFDEDTWVNSPKRIENLFGCEFQYTEGSTPWLVPGTNDPDEFQQILDTAESTNISSWVFSDDFLLEWQDRKRRGCPTPALGTGSRGPATIMTSVLHPETVFYWIHDRPEIMSRFRDILTKKMIELNKVLREFSGCKEAGWWITDDNSALFNRRLYREYCVPVLHAVLDEFSPPGSRRYQHSDSAMGHLLEEQAELGINEVNYGPTVDAGLIRQKLPEAHIFGQVPPMLLRNGSPSDIRERVHSDFQKAGESRRLTIATAGSLAAGTGLGRMRWLMDCVQTETRYQ
jgi:uroporphyrinogen decarboxylase